MIAEIGHFALILALLVGLVQAIVPMVGAARGDLAWMRVGTMGALAQMALVALSFLALTWCYVTSDFSVLSVVSNSHSEKPLLYKISGVWSNHEGSMLLWVLILVLYGGAVAAFGRNLPPALKARALAVQAMVGCGFLAFIILTSNPFLRLDPAPADGRGLNPMLQDPGLAFHPPFLYLGYVGFSMAFSFAIAALIEGRVDAAWARWVRPWTLAAWVSLTLGIALGSWWAYYTLGWGGWWYWDPVENASFMPWLAGTALLHSSIVVEKRDALKGWTILLAILTFSLSLLGTFLVRSGVLTSVHSFAADPARGVFVLALLALCCGGSLTLFAARAPSMAAGSLFQPVSREGGLLFNNVLLATGTGSVLLGTLYPLFADALDIGKISVGPPFFNAVFLPLMVPLVVAMAAGPLLAWKRGDMGRALRRLVPALAGALAAGLLALWLQPAHPISSAGGLALAAWLGLGALIEWGHRLGLGRTGRWRRLIDLPRAAHGMMLGHLGLALMILGIAGQAGWSDERIAVLKPGQSLSVGGFDVALRGIEEGIPGPNYDATRATFDVSRQGRAVGVMAPERRLFRTPPRPTTDAAIRATLAGNLYVVIGEPDKTGGWVVRSYYHSLVPWIFIGAGVMALGGLVSLTDRRHRVGAPAARARATSPQPQKREA